MLVILAFNIRHICTEEEKEVHAPELCLVALSDDKTFLLEF